MAKIWFSKDGSRPYNQSGPGIQVTSEEAQAIVGLRQAIFAGKDAPSINPDKPSHSLKNVVLEIEDSAEVSAILPKVGFYLISGISPKEAQHALNIQRKQTQNKL